MKNSFLLRFAICLFALSTILTSCSKENSEVVEETIEEAKPLLLISMNGLTTEYNAYAAYCNNNGSEAITVSNNPALLDEFNWIGSMAADDFIILYKNDGTTEVSIGGTAFTVINTNGDEVVAAVLSGDADVNITESNSTQVAGDMSGTFTVQTDEFTESFTFGEGDDELVIDVSAPGVNETTVTFSATFLAEVDPLATPVLCD